jgi:hypothetical protein
VVCSRNGGLLQRNQWDIPVEIDMEPTKLQLPEHHLPDIMFVVALDAFRVHLGLSKSGEMCTFNIWPSKKGDVMDTNV